MLTIEKMSYGYPQKDLYDEVSLTLERGEHCAFMGASGSGKSTLIKMIIDPESVMYDGKVILETEGNIGYVSQFSEVTEADDLSVFDYIAKRYMDCQSEIERLCDEMATTEDLESVMEAYQVALDTFNAIGGDGYESQINIQLGLAGLETYKNMNVTKLSGGEFKLIQIIRELLTSPDLVIMDEPDVFLDFKNLLALKKLINYHKGTLLVVTHNRYLLEHCFNKIWHLENQKIREVEGTYRVYNYKLLEEKIDQLEAALEDEAEIARNAVLIDRLRMIATFNTEKARGKSLKARVKIQERLLEKQTQAPYIENKKRALELSSIDIEETESEGEILVALKDYQVGFDELLLDHVSFEIKEGEKIALVGDNGTGKTTLMRDIFSHDKKSIQVNDHTKIAYLSQIQSEVLNEDKTVIDEMMDFGFDTYTAAESYLRGFGLNSELVHQKIGDLSGGEKNTLQIAKLSASNGNLLLLDEPTSHLDLYSQLALEEAINAYEGAVLMISHDYQSIVNCMDYVLLLENQTVRKVKMKKFKRQVYDAYFDRAVLESQEKNKAVEVEISDALRADDFEKARILLENFRLE